MLTSEFDYDLPPEAIAQTAIEPRDQSRLLRVDGLEDLRFSDLGDLLREGDLLVVNRTRVRAARLRGHRSDTGGAVEALLLKRIDVERWKALLRPARRLRSGIELRFGDITAVIVSGPIDGVATMRLTSHRGDVEDVLPEVGEVPLPPYFTGQLRDPERYQTLFGTTLGSAAAPTAALHFTPSLRDSLQAMGVGFAEVDLHVGLDTFRPMIEERLDQHRIHREQFEVFDETADQIVQARAEGCRVVAVGTTSVRALESAASGRGLITSLSGESELFIQPGYRARVVDALITNFHAPRSTLIALVAAFLPQWRRVYDHALGSDYRFLSFGDAMFIEGIRS